MRPYLILNPAAGAAATAEQSLNERLSARCDVHRTVEVGDARRLAREAVDRGAQRIIAAGGDGTLTEVLNGIAPQLDAVELAVVPLGTGNDLARSLGIPEDEIDAAVQLAVDGDAVAIDVGRFDGRERLHFLNAVSGGFGGDVSARLDSDAKQQWGPLAYWMTAISQLPNLAACDLHLELDDEVVEVEAYGVLAANGRCVGGGFTVAPKAAVDDGVLDIAVIAVQPTTRLIAAGFDALLQRHELSKHILTRRCRSLKITSKPPMAFSVDGDRVGRTDAAVELLPRALRMVVGTTAPAVNGCADDDAAS